VLQRHGEALVTQYLARVGALLIYIDAQGGRPPAEHPRPRGQAYLAERLTQGSASRRRFLRASVRILLETDKRATGAAASAPRPPQYWAWHSSPRCAPIAVLREHRGLAERTIGTRVWHLGQFAALVEQAGVLAC
jgi:hypothetical protein